LIISHLDPNIFDEEVLWQTNRKDAPV
jgi:hypothetical protein